MPCQLCPNVRCRGELCPDARRPGIRRLNARCHGVLRPNSHCLCVSRWERYVPCQSASRASRAPGALGHSLCVQTQIFFPDGLTHGRSGTHNSYGPGIHNSQVSIVGFTDSDWARNLMTRKSIGGCVFGLRHIDDNDELAISGLIHWQAKLLK